jgi:hypothetical protein
MAFDMRHLPPRCIILKEKVRENLAIEGERLLGEGRIISPESRFCPSAEEPPGAGTAADLEYTTSIIKR